MVYCHFVHTFGSQMHRQICAYILPLSRSIKMKPMKLTQPQIYDNRFVYE
jgi:hypothetical protein